MTWGKWYQGKDSQRSVIQHHGPAEGPMPAGMKQDEMTAS